MDDTSKTKTEGCDIERSMAEAEGLYNKGYYERAFVIYLRLADLGFSPAQFKAGEMYHYGVGTRTDYAKALKYYQLATDQHYTIAGYHLALMYCNGQGVERNLKKALQIIHSLRDEEEKKEK